MPEAGGRGGDRAALPGSPSAGRRKTPAAGTLEDARKLLWSALKRGAKVLRSADDTTALKGVHAVSQAAAAYARIVEVSELEGRIKALEDAQGEP